jgi:hypothetical protein
VLKRRRQPGDHAAIDAAASVRLAPGKGSGLGECCFQVVARSEARVDLPRSRGHLAPNEQFLVQEARMQDEHCR